ncbi:MAG: hypothetical protein K0Q77_1687 [Anaerosporomusa subterranea]|nr:hypothetical protein [Anaerosporomusa subterranea]
MCLILFAYQYHPEYPLIIAANRDEFYARPTLSADYWSDAPNILAGRDLEHGGAWLGVTRTGRLAALTNYRDPARQRTDALSRGQLSAKYLNSNLSPTEYIEMICPETGSYNGFNLLVGDLSSLCYYSNQTNELVVVNPGIHGLSNHLLDTPWPKVKRGKQLLQQALIDSVDTMGLLALLGDDQRPDDSQLPNTGVGLEMERVLSPMFIATEGYGTRAMSVLTFRHDGLVQFSERSRNESGEWKYNSYQFRL